MNTLDLKSLIEIGAIVVAAVWAIAEIRGTTRVLNNSIMHLTKEVGTLAKSVDALHDKHESMEDRVRNLEVFQGASRGVRT